MNVAHGLCFGEEAGARNIVFFPCKVVAAGDERYLACAAVAAGVVSVAKWFLLCVLQRVVVPVCVVMRFLKLWWQIALEWLHECCTWATFWRGSRSTKPSMCFATSGCSCVRSSMRFLNLWLQIPLEWLHGCCHLALPLSVVLSCFANSVSADRIVAAASRLLGTAAACVILLPFAAGSRK